ncbi:Hydantoin utilization protein A [Sphaceloma murrayae]|uniref:Hydantoin utilization protein A n=1 Tax=Sphaceloma murrayae TaxID=2082308 RepID=A0A2K1QHK8_9PEZI|nr:Hydantoin utilization protein A [Sphaceloma murrayae]
MTTRYRVGVDVGGTNTDAVVLSISDSGEVQDVVSAFKTPTTPNATEGISLALEHVLEVSKIPVKDIDCVVIGTTAFLNAVVEQDPRRLSKVGIVRLSRSFLREIPPFSDWPEGLAAVCDGYVGHIDGGLAIDGSEEAPIREAQVIEQCKEIKRLGLSSVVVAGVYSPIDEIFKQEDQVAKIIARELPDVDIVRSHTVSNIGFKERENASILNAAILRYARRTLREFKASMKALNLTCPLYLTQNDGTVVDCKTASDIPIRTFSSGPTNSMRGAAFLAGIRGVQESTTIVIDVGGTTSDIGILEKSGFPRQASAYVSVADVMVNYSMPQLHSIGIGGGSLVRTYGDKVVVGPDSVGHRLTSDALVFGGESLTATDITVASGVATVGDISAVKSLNQALIAKAQDNVKLQLEAAIDRVKTSPEPLRVLLVGGGSIVAPKQLKGASELVLPPHHDVANAVGAAIASVSGVVDMVQNTSIKTASEALEYAKTLALENAIAAGAKKDTVVIAEIDAIPLQYVTNQVRTIVKAIGELDASSQRPDDGLGDEIESDVSVDAAQDTPQTRKDTTKTLIDPVKYKPTIIDNAQGIPEWHITETDLSWFTWGMYILGCAGGGNPDSSRVLLRDHLRKGHRMRVIDASALTEDANIYWGGHMGSPAVSVERLASTETVQAVQALMEYMRHDSFDAVMGLEIGGANGLEPFLLGSSKYYDRPVIDADWMGRAYPTYWQTTLAAHKPGELVPCAIDSGDGKTIIMTRAPDDEIVDRALRASCSEMGSRVGMAAKPTKTDYVRKYGVMNTVSLAWRIGRCIAVARANNTISRVAEAIVEQAGGRESAKILFRGKITAVDRRLYKGHSLGKITITGATEEETKDALGGDAEATAWGGVLEIPFKNENILAEHTDDRGEKRIIATVPDLIAVLDAGTGLALGVPEFKYGVPVVVVGITCSPRWTEAPIGLDISAPRIFGFDVDYMPLGKFVEPRSVIEEYRTRSG